jgi:hypothetical protein
MDGLKTGAMNHEQLSLALFSAVLAILCLHVSDVPKREDELSEIEGGGQGVIRHDAEATAAN